MNIEWEADLRFKIQRQLKGKGLKKSNKGMKNLVDAVTIQLTNEYIGNDYKAKNPQINIFGANLILLLSDEKNLLTFKHSGSHTVLPASYIEMLYDNIIRGHDTNTCEIPANDTIRLQIDFISEIRELIVYYFDYDKMDWEICTEITDINRYINSNSHHFTINGVSNLGTKTTITLEEATLTEKKMDLENKDAFSDK